MRFSAGSSGEVDSMISLTRLVIASVVFARWSWQRSQYQRDSVGQSSAVEMRTLWMRV